MFRNIALLTHFLRQRFFCTLPKGKYYPFDGQYLPINGFKVTFNGVIQLLSVHRTWISTQTESSSESDWENPMQTPLEWSHCGITSSENFNFFYVILFSWIICPIEGVLLTDGIFPKGNYVSHERTFLSVNGIQFSLCGTPTNLIFAHSARVEGRGTLGIYDWCSQSWLLDAPLPPPLHTLEPSLSIPRVWISSLQPSRALSLLLISVPWFSKFLLIFDHLSRVGFSHPLKKKKSTSKEPFTIGKCPRRNWPTAISYRNNSGGITRGFASAARFKNNVHRRDFGRRPIGFFF